MMNEIISLVYGLLIGKSHDDYNQFFEQFFEQDHFQPESNMVLVYIVARHFVVFTSSQKFFHSVRRYRFAGPLILSCFLNANENMKKLMKKFKKYIQ